METAITNGTYRYNNEPLFDSDTSKQFECNLTNSHSLHQSNFQSNKHGNNLQESERPIILFRKQDGSSWVIVVRKPFGEVKGFIKGNRGNIRPLTLKNIPSSLQLEDVNKAKSIFKQSRIALTDYCIEVLPGLKGGMYTDSATNSNVQDSICLSKGLKYLKSQESFSEASPFFIKDSGLTYKVGQELGGYIFEKDKVKGVEPGFIGKKRWLAKDTENMLTNPKNKYFRQAKAFINDKYPQKLKIFIIEKCDQEMHNFILNQLSSLNNNVISEELKDLLGLEVRLPFNQLSEADQTKVFNHFKEDADIQAAFIDSHPEIQKAFLRHHEDIQTAIIKQLTANNKKFNYLHHIKLDYKEVDRREEKVYRSAKSIQGLTSTNWVSKERRDANFTAIRQCLASDLMKALGIYTQNLRLIPAQYADGKPKLLLEGVDIESLNPEGFFDFNKKLYNGYLTQDITTGSSPSSILQTDQSIEDLGSFKIMLLLLGANNMLGTKGDNSGYINHTQSKTFAGIHPGHALEIGTGLMNFKNIRNDFSFDQLPLTSGNVNQDYKNFSIFDDTPFLQKMEGVKEIWRLRDTGEDTAIFEAYGTHFNGSLHKDLNFETEIQAIRKAYIKRRNYILDDVFEKRSPFMRSKEGKIALNILDCLEKQTSITIETIKDQSWSSWVATKPTLQLKYPKVTERLEWSLSQINKSDYLFQSQSLKDPTAIFKKLESFKLQDLAGLELSQSNNTTTLKCSPQSVEKLNTLLDTFKQYTAYTNSYNRIKILDLGSISKLTEMSLRSVLKKNPELKELTLNANMQLTESMWKQLADLSGLERLNLQGFTDLTEFTLEKFLKLHRLVTLNFKDSSQLTDKGLMQMLKLPNLKSIYLSGCDQLTSIGLSQLAGAYALNKLYLDGCIQVTDGVLNQLKTLQPLSSLNLNGCAQVTNESLTQIIQMQSLETLNLGNCEAITDEGVLQLGALPNLKILNLEGCPYITDAAVEHLRQLLPNLDVHV